MPLIRLEVEGMKHAIVTALGQYTASIDADVRRAVEQVCEPENLRRVIEEAVAREFRQVLEQEVAGYFKWGEGRKLVKALATGLLEEALARLRGGAVGGEP